MCNDAVGFIENPTGVAISKDICMAIVECKILLCATEIVVVNRFCRQTSNLKEKVNFFSY